MSGERSELNGERSAPRGAVFLSYASQDAEAVLRIAEALRASGVEVWFDKDELTGGDAWDQKIRNQIKACALFVPVISAATNARREGYFRREWKIAVDRTHDMDEALPFLVPVVIDATTDAGAFVPEKFREVQWTRLPGGETPPAFCERVQHLLGGEGVAGVADPGRPASTRPATIRPASRAALPRLALGAFAILVVGVGLYFALRPHRSPEEIEKLIASVETIAANAAAKSTPTPQSAPAAAPLTKAQQLVAQARALYEPWDFANGDDFKLAEQLLKQATDLEPSNAEAWAALAIEATGQNFFGFDRSDARDALLRTAADRAVRLAPDSDFARLAQAVRYRRGPGTDDEALRLLFELEPRHGSDKFVLRQLGSALASKNRAAEALAIYVRAAALPGGDAIALAAQSRVLRKLHRLDEAESALNQAIVLRPDYGQAHVLKIVGRLYDYGDLARTKEALQQIPARVMIDERVAAVAAFMWYFAHDADKASEALRYVAHDYVESNVITAPKGLVAGLVHRLAGRSDAAAIEWRQALRVVEQRSAANPSSAGDAGDRAALLAMLGDRAAAEPALRIYEQLARVPPGRATTGSWLIYAELGHAGEVADFFTAQMKSSDNGSTFAALFRFHPALDRFRDQPRFQTLAAETDRIFAANASTGQDAGKPTTDNKSTPAGKSVAVLAFADLSAGHDSEYFSDGISEELLNVLAKVPGLKVTARTSAFFFKGKNLPIPEIAQKLGVAYVVEGSVQRAGEQVKITAQLIKAADGFHVWSETFKRDAKDVFAVEEEIAGLIAKQLSLKLGASSAASTASVNPEAFVLYAQARQAWNLRTDEGFARSEQLLARALDLEPNFARAHAAMADVWTLQGQRDDQVAAFGLREGPAAARIAAKCELALKLDPNSAEAHASLGQHYWSVWRLADSERELREAIRLNSSYASAHQWLGRALLLDGRLDEALVELQRATELDPLSPRILDNYAWALIFAGRYGEAIQFCDRALNLQRTATQARALKAVALAQMGRLEAAAELAYTLPNEDSGISMFRAIVFGLAGKTAEAEKALTGYKAGSHISKVAGLAALKRYDEALNVFDSFWIPSTRADYLLFHPIFDPMRSDPHFVKFLATLGLTEAHARAQAWRAAHPPEKVEAKK